MLSGIVSDPSSNDGKGSLAGKNDKDREVQGSESKAGFSRRSSRSKGNLKRFFVSRIERIDWSRGSGGSTKGQRA